jgi:hypothetical protein
MTRSGGSPAPLNLTMPISVWSASTMYSLPSSIGSPSSLVT